MALGSFAGLVVRRVREEAGLSQALMARRANVSASYLNQIEHNRRRLTPELQVRFAQVLGVDARALGIEDESQTAAALVDALAEHPDLPGLPLPEVRALTEQLPEVAALLLRLAEDRRRDRDRLDVMATQLGADRDLDPGPGQPYEEVRDFFAAHGNYFDDLDRRAEQLAARLKLAPRRRHEQLARHLSALGVRVEEVPRDRVGGLREYDAEQRLLLIADDLRPTQRAFQMATQIALIEADPMIAAIADELDNPVTRHLARIGLAHYFAGAVLLPYGTFVAAARRVRYDIELLGQEFDVGFEQLCHRLIALQRPGDRGVPFALVRVDRAGNISKRQSANPFHFSRAGGTCPLWTVYDAFSRPGEIATQLAEMPDGRAHLWIARTVTTSQAGFGAPRKTFAIGLGCDIEHASELVYSSGLDLGDHSARTPIGMGCKVCDRPSCPQRAIPFAGRTLQVDENRSQFFPYRHEGDADLRSPGP